MIMMHMTLQPLPTGVLPPFLLGHTFTAKSFLPRGVHLHHYLAAFAVRTILHAHAAVLCDK